jgi:hypothetical protein
MALSHALEEPSKILHLVAKRAAKEQPLPEGCIAAFIRAQNFMIWNIDLRGITAMDSFFCHPIGEPVVLN